VLRWRRGADEQGPFWGGKLDGAFLMLVPVRRVPGTPATFEIWFAGLVFETAITSLLAAKAHAAKLLGAHMTRLGEALAALSTATPSSPVFPPSIVHLLSLSKEAA
jgi:hypothetical protein